jgi:hypothetical protein
VRAQRLVPPSASGAFENPEGLLVVARGGRRLGGDLHGSDRGWVLASDDKRLPRLTGAQCRRRLHNVGRLRIRITQAGEFWGNGAGLIGQDGRAEVDESEKGTDELIWPSRGRCLQCTPQRLLDLVANIGCLGQSDGTDQIALDGVGDTSGEFDGEQMLTSVGRGNCSSLTHSRIARLHIGGNATWGREYKHQCAMWIAVRSGSHGDRHGFPAVRIPGAPPIASQQR